MSTIMDGMTRLLLWFLLYTNAIQNTVYPINYKYVFKVTSLQTKYYHLIYEKIECWGLLCSSISKLREFYH